MRCKVKMYAKYLSLAAMVAFLICACNHEPKQKTSRDKNHKRDLSSVPIPIGPFVERENRGKMSGGVTKRSQTFAAEFCRCETEIDTVYGFVWGYGRAEAYQRYGLLYPCESNGRIQLSFSWRGHEQWYNSVSSILGEGKTPIIYYHYNSDWVNAVIDSVAVKSL